MKPSGLEHQEREFAVVKVPHELILYHQEAFPDLAKGMNNSPDAMKVYAAFLVLLPLKVKGELTQDKRRKILEVYKQ